MYRPIVAALITSLSLAACQTAAPNPEKAAVFQEDIARLRVDRDARRISYAEWAERTGAAVRMNVTLSPDQEAAVAYRTQLARRVDAGEMTPRQFERESARTLERVKSGNRGV
ncbi:hypothetical protein ACFZ8E_26600 [Methylobacterium sp. HMF5984]|uniref:hypothetical protein n=1 Tax=Methylobacterium sp. HMF5984 TaxID=3367370 RepID=UPI0038520A54